MRVRQRLRGRRKTKGLIKEENSLHVNMHQTDQLATVEFAIATYKIIDLGFSGERKHRYTNRPAIFCVSRIRTSCLKSLITATYEG